MSVTDNLNITEVATNQTQKEVTINTALNALDNAGNKPLAVTFTTNARTISQAEFTRNFSFVAGNQTATAAMTVPLTNRFFAVRNTNATYAITVGGVTGAAVSVPVSSIMLVCCDGTNCYAFAVSAASGVTSILGDTGTVVLSQLVSGGVMPISNATPTGTMDASAATAVKVPTVASNDNSTNAASTAFVNAFVAATLQGLQPKPAAQWATAGTLTANTYANGTAGVGATLTGSANGALSVDGGNPAANDIVLVKDESTASHNGLYTVTTVGDGSHAYVLTRHAAMDVASEFMGALVVVENNGAANNNSMWLCTNASAPIVGSTSITFTGLNKLGDVIAGTGLARSGNTISLASIADGDLLANTSGGSAAPSAHTLTAFLDAKLGNTDGDIAIRQSGAWTAVSALDYLQLPAEVQNVTMAFPFSGLPGDGQAVCVPVAQALTLPANFSGAVGYSDANATASAVFTLAFIRAGSTTSIGTVTFTNAGSGGALSTQSAVNLLAGDVLKLTAPSPQDATLANVGVTFVLQKV